MNLKNKIPLNEIKYVLLDMDGTLLDKYFDDYFWEHLVPEKYAEKNCITFGKAKANSKIKPKLSKDFMHIFDFEELIG
ncbi:MAG: hypothetical protein AUJ60_08885 [Nitrospirae bacterium CG1_02_44_142]|nr:MAG: hypothetical protein AUJ60_08885 [Nitrospirae bacterium CG1_02_44_142]